MKIQRIVYPSVFFLSFILFLGIYLIFLNRSFSNSFGDTVIKITKGDNLRSVAMKLEQGQVIYNQTLFIIAGKILGYQDQIIPGEYKFTNGLTNLNILKSITDASQTKVYTITIPEGLNVRQIGRLLARTQGLDSAKVCQRNI